MLLTTGVGKQKGQTVGKENSHLSYQFRSFFFLLSGSMEETTWKPIWCYFGNNQNAEVYLLAIHILFLSTNTPVKQHHAALCQRCKGQRVR